MLVFNSDDLGPKHRVEAWQDFSARTVAAMKSVPAGEHRFQVNAEGKVIGDLIMGRLTGAGYASERTSFEIAQQRHHYYGAVIHLQGRPLLRSLRHLTRVQPGDISILSTMESFWFDGQTPFEYIVVRLPERWPKALVLRPDRLCGTVIPHANPLRRILADYVRACRMITSRATDPDLRTEEIARQLRISVRMLQRIFKENNETVAQRIAMARITRSATMLANDRVNGVTITEIAFASGFRDLTTFERAFCAFKGMTPSAWRRRALE